MKQTSSILSHAPVHAGPRHPRLSIQDFIIMYLSAYESKPGAARAPQPGFIPLAFITAVAAALSGTATGMRCRGRSTGSLPAIPAYDLRALYDHGSGELSPRFDH